MSTDIQRLLAAPGLEATAFDASSRYHGLEVKQHIDESEVVRSYVARRLIPPEDAHGTLTHHAVVEGDRIDNIAFSHLGSPLAYWQICDANAALRPSELTEDVSATLRITTPAGLSGQGSV